MSTMLADYQSGTTQTLTRTLSTVAGTYVMLYTGCTGSAGQTGTITATVTAGTGWAPTKLAAVEPAVANGCAAAVFGGFATATGNIDVAVTFSGAPADGFTYAESELLVDPSTPIAGAVTGSGTTATTPSLTLTTAPAVIDEVRGLFVMRNKTAAATPGRGALVRAGFHIAPCAGMLLQNDTGSTATAVGASDMGTTYNAGIAFTVRKTGATPPPTVHYWDGTTLQPVAGVFEWTGSALQAVTLEPGL